MDQIKIGKFISKKRKEKSLTQQELADLIGVSNKTISKWECGKGMPEVSLMLPLCEKLEISVNELLSGESLDSSYKEKAEENLVGLIKQNQTDKWDAKKTSLWQLASLIFSIVFWLLFFADSNIYQLGHKPTPLTTCYLIVGFISIYAVITTSIYGIIKRNLSMIFAALSFASLVCLLICLGYGTFWLMIPAIIGLFICLVLSILSFYKGKH